MQKRMLRDDEGASVGDRVGELKRVGMMSVAEFKRRLLSMSLSISLCTVVLITLYLYLLLRLSPGQWRGFCVVVGVGFVVLFAALRLSTRRLVAEILACLSAEERGGASREQCEAAYGCLAAYPVRGALVSTLWWSGGGFFGAVAMKLWFPSLTLYPLFVMWLATTTGGLASSIVRYFISKDWLSELLGKLAERIGDPEERGGRMSRVTLRQKITFSVSAVTMAIVGFGAALSLGESGQALERNATRIQAAYLRELIDGEANLDLDQETSRVRRIGIAGQLLRLDATSGRVLEGPADLLSGEERDWVMSDLEGTSVDFDSGHVFAWLRAGESGDVWVAASRWSDVSGEGRRFAVIFVGILLVSTLFTFGLAELLSRDLTSRTAQLQRRVVEVRDGDLRRAVPIESEDELGDLAREFEEMIDGLRSTVGGVAAAAETVDAVAGELSTIASDVARGAQEQNEGVAEAARSMESLSSQVGEISASAQELNLVVEESSSSILELGAASDEMNDTAGVLSSQVGEVSSSIEEMARSVGQVASQADVLSAAATETSSSMEEMAAAMREVDCAAEDASQLSQKAVEVAEGGRTTVREAIEGMESISKSTLLAESVIVGLSERVGQIGSILDVIDDVAEETNLLALNAAIIAAQAGERGSAFSVVADEIKELADRVLASTKEIGELIGGVQRESENAVEAIAEGSRSVEAGVSRSSQAGIALDEITRVSRENGERIHEIVRSVREQSKAATHVVDMMERVSGGAEAILGASEEQSRGNRAVSEAVHSMRDVAQQLRATTEEQSRGSARIRQNIESVRSAVGSINGALQAHANVSEEVVGFLEEVAGGSRASDASAGRMSEVTQLLLARAEVLREGAGLFRLEQGSAREPVAD